MVTSYLYVNRNEVEFICLETVVVVIFALMW